MKATAVAPATAYEVCTHKSEVSLFEDFIKSCTDQKVETSCVTKGYCTWNKTPFNEAPSQAPDTCTHTAAESGVETKVQLCKGFTTMDIC